MSSTWKIQVVRVGSTYRWKLVNRDGDVVMTSREKYPTEASVRAAIESERAALRELQAA
jgi:uncharacterized protein YegP (UPF0339 family)